MTLWPRLLLIPVGLLALSFGSILVDSGDAWAQIGPNQLPQPGATPGPGINKNDGVAEQAKEGPDRLPTTPVLPQLKNERKGFELVELNGYFRFRSDWLKKFHLGFHDRAGGGAPFPAPTGCFLPGEEVPVGPGSCEDRIKTANIRLRLEPTINVTETTKIHMQIDVLDNLVLGSTPDSAGLGTPSGNLTLGAFSDIQAPPQSGRNNLTDSVIVRRAWAEIDTSLGHLTFGRQPWHWGMGIFANAGGANPFSGTYDMDNDFGDTVDRVMFRAGIPGTDLYAAIATDWTVTSPSAAQSDLFASRYDSQPWDLNDTDDVAQWVFMITRFDKPKLFAKDVAKGKWALNYGGMLAYRTQEWATKEPGDDETFAEALVYRGLKTYTPDVWLKLAHKRFTFELEAVATIGSIDNVSDIELPRYPADPNDPDALDAPVDGSVDIRRFGGVARVSYEVLDGKALTQFEVGFASGDQWDHVRPGDTNVRGARPLPIGGGDTKIENFLFDFGYNVDMILFRELLGTVTNATYLKPSFMYQVTDSIKANAAGILSFANRPVATPGNGTAYGLELNADVSYRAGPFTAGIAYGVLFPMGAMDHPIDANFGFDANNRGEDGTGDASTAQTVQGRLMLRF